MVQFMVQFFTEIYVATLNNKSIFTFLIRFKVKLTKSLKSLLAHIKFFVLIINSD